MSGRFASIAEALKSAADCRRAGRHDLEAATLLRAAELWPDDLSIRNELANALHRCGRIDDAIEQYRCAVALNPDCAAVHFNLGDTLFSVGRLDEALASLARAVELAPDDPQIHNHLGAVWSAKRQFHRAIACFRRALELDENDAAALNNLGAALTATGALDEAIAACDRSLAIDPADPKTHNNLANALREGGRVDDALAAYRRALQVGPDCADAHSNMLHLMYLHPAFEPAEILAAHREWDRMHGMKPVAGKGRHPNDPSPDRVLRIGFVSADFRNHVVPRFLIGPLEHLDRRSFRVICFSGVSNEDSVTRQIRGMVDEWHQIVGLSDDQTAALIRSCKIDLLIDLSLHLAGGRLAVFARKPAPVQVTALAYPGTSGLAAMDYRLTDPYLDPPGNESYCSEQSIRLKSYWCYQPWQVQIEVGELPAITRGQITFACLNHFAKVSDPALAAFAQVLARNPRSRLILYTPPGSHCQRVVQAMTAAGVAPNRVEFHLTQPIDEYLRSYNQIDIALDPFPCTGGTTTCDATWMGVPTVTLAGKTAMGRTGVSIMSQVGLTSMIASTIDEYVDIATRSAADLVSLAHLRRTLRAKMLASPLSDPLSFTRDVETQLRWVWQQCCNKA